MALVQQSDGGFEVEREPHGDRGRAVPFATYRRNKGRSALNDVSTDYSDEELQFLRAMQALKAKHPFPTWCQVLAAVKAMGYEKKA